LFLRLALAAFVIAAAHANPVAVAAPQALQCGGPYPGGYPSARWEMCRMLPMALEATPTNHP
jgi:hypothetical protein